MFKVSIRKKGNSKWNISFSYFLFELNKYNLAKKKGVRKGGRVKS